MMKLTKAEIAILIEQFNPRTVNVDLLTILQKHAENSSRLSVSDLQDDIWTLLKMNLEMATGLDFSTGERVNSFDKAQFKNFLNTTCQSICKGIQQSIAKELESYIKNTMLQGWQQKKEERNPVPVLCLSGHPNTQALQTSSESSMNHSVRPEASSPPTRQSRKRHRTPTVRGDK